MGDTLWMVEDGKCHYWCERSEVVAGAGNGRLWKQCDASQ